MSFSDMFKGTTDLTGKKCFNRDTTVNTLDVLGFLNAWTAGALEADTDRNGLISFDEFCGWMARLARGESVIKC